MVSPYNGPYFRGIYLNSNDLAAFLALTLPALLWSRERKEWLGSLPFQGAIATLALIANLVILYLSRSRTGIAAALLVLLIYSVFRSKRLAVVGLFGAIVVALAAPSLLRQGQQNVLYKGLPPVQSLADRRALVTASLVAAESRVLEGHGFGVSVGASQTWSGALTTRDTSREKSSSVLGAIEEVGLIGTVPLLLSILAAIVIAYKRVRAEASSAARAAAIALFSIVAAGLLHSQSESWLTSAGSTSALIFWTTLGIIILRGSHQVRSQAPS
jgi:O-antigen ligase